MPIDLWCSLPSDDDSRPTPRERREAEARRLAFSESSLLPKTTPHLCPRCKVNPRKGESRECGRCLAERAMRAEVKRAGGAGVVITKGSRRDLASVLVAAGVARWGTQAERKASRARLIDGATLVFAVER